MSNTGNISSFNSINTWNSLTSYEKDDIVLYQGNYYFALKNISQTTPVEGLNTYWSSQSVFSWKSSFSSSVSYKLNTRLTNFLPSAGAINVKKSNINNALIILDLIFDTRNEKTLKAILFFLELKRGVESFSFYIPSPYSYYINCICQKWQHNYKFGNNHEITATFEEVS